MRPIAATLVPIRNCLRVQRLLMFFGVDVVSIDSFLFVKHENTAAPKSNDKNVVTDREKVADSQNQDATKTWLKRFAQNLEQLVPIVSADGELCSVLQ